MTSIFYEGITAIPAWFYITYIVIVNVFVPLLMAASLVVLLY